MKHYINGKIYLEKGTFANSFSVEDQKIVSINIDDKDIKDSDQVIDLGGKTVLPGLYDSHLHLGALGNSLTYLKLNGAKSIDEIIAKGKKYLEENPNIDFIFAQGWNQDLFQDQKRMPNRYDLDKISKDIPIIAERVCVHVVSLNSKALEILGIDSSKKIDGGEIHLDDKGELLGIFSENAANFARQILPKDTKQALQDKFMLAVNHALKNGITSVNSCDVFMTEGYDFTYRAIYELYRDKKSPLRYFSQVNLNSIESYKNFLNDWDKEEYYDDVFRRGAIKLFKDGSLGARTALMRDFYKDDPTTKGVDTISKEDFEGICQLAKDNNLPVHVHVIGDGAIEAVTDSFIKFGKEENPLRNTLVHCQITDYPLLEKIAKHNIYVQYQPVFLDYDISIVEDRVGKEMASTSYAFNTLYNKLGAHTSYGTDAPVEDLNPFDCIYAAVTRKTRQNYPEGGFYPEEKVSVEDAIDCYTKESAYSTFMEDKIGRIKEGYYADFIILDEDIFTIDEDKIKDIKVLETFINGKSVYKKEN